MKSIAIFFVLISSCRGVTFDGFCAERFASWAVPEEKFYTCFVTKVAGTSEQKLTSVTSNFIHSPGKSNSDVEVIEILGNEDLNFLPKEMEKTFSSLIGIKISDCKLSLGPDGLKSYKALKYFGATEAGLKEIPGNFFESTPDVKAIDFTDNKIEELSREFLRNLEKLEDLSWLSFKGNNCTSKAATSKEEVQELMKNLKETCSTSGVDGGLKATKILQVISIIMTVIFLKM